MEKEQLLYHYFSNSLSVEQEKQLQDLLETDAEFKEQFDFEKDLKRVVRDEEKNKLKSKLQDFEKEIVLEKPVIQLNDNREKRSFNWSIAASVAILFGLGWFGYNTFGGTDYEDLYQENFQEYPNTVYEITRGEGSESIERLAFSAYETGDYNTAIDNFNKIKPENRQDYIDFYVAQSYLNLEQIQEAKPLFRQIISSKSKFVAESHWYLSLILLKEKDTAAAREQLKLLTTQFNYNKEKAVQLLSALE